MRRIWIVAILLVLLVPVLAACAPAAGPAEPQEAEQVDVEQEPGDEALAGTITVAGSSTVQPLAERFAEAFSAIHPDVRIEVKGGGTGIGVKSAGEGIVDFGMASRDVEDSELAEFPDLQTHVVALDGIAIIAHPDVAVDDLSIEQVRDIFAGQITNWSEVGGPDRIITVVSREEGSGTRGAFEDMVMGDDALIAATAILQMTNGAVRTTVATTSDSIGYLSFGYLDDSVKTISIDGTAPTMENAVAGTYPVVRPLNMLTRGEPSGLPLAWLEFMVGPEGQAIVVEEGYLPIQ